MSARLIRNLLLVCIIAAFSVSAATLDVDRYRIESGTDYGESGDVDDHEESAVPLWMAGFTATNNIEVNDTWLALRSQQMLAWDEPISNVLWLGSHNAFNSLGGVFPFQNDGVATVLGTAPNQSVSIIGQLNLGARLIELDLWAGGDGTDLFLRHGKVDLTSDIEIDFDQALLGIAQWLGEPENANEIVFLDFEDAVEQKDIKPGLTGARSTLNAALDSAFGSEIYLPSDLQADGAWPSRRALVEAGKRVIIFTHRNDANGSVFGSHVNSGQGWWYAGKAFLADGSDAAGFGNFEQEGLSDLRSTAIDPEGTSVFSAMQSDGLDITSAPAAKTLDMIYTASRNINFAKVDFIFGYQNDVDNDYDTPDEDDPLQELGPFDTHPHRGNRLRGLVWSWAENDPAVQRQWFQDFAGAGTGAALQAFFEFYFSNSAMGANGKAKKDLEIALEQLLGGDRAAWQWPALITDMATRGANARANGRDYAKQVSLGSNWQSATGSERLPWVLRSTEREPNNGPYRWKITTETGRYNEWPSINLANYTDSDGMTYVFGAPVNGFQNGNFDLRMLHEDVMNQPNVLNDLVEPYKDLYLRKAHSVFEARIKNAFDASYAVVPNFLNAFLSSYATSATPVWINVHDADRDGIWVANDLTHIPTPGTGGPYTVNEGGNVQLIPTSPPGTVSVTWDLDGDLVFGETGPGAGNGDEDVEQPSFIATGLDGPLTHGIRMRAKPAAGDIKEYTGIVKVLNVAPGLSLNADLVTGPGLGGQVELTVLIDEPGTTDKSTLDIDWDDGSPIQQVELGYGRSTTQSHTYVAAVPISPDITVVADDGDATTTRNTQITIAPCELGVTFNDGTDGFCHPCATTCPSGFGTSQACTLVADTQCGNACVAGISFNTGDSLFCSSCRTTCPAGTGAITDCSVVSDAVCAPCPPGTGNDGSSLVCTEIIATYMVTPSASPGGQILPATVQVADENSTVEFTLAPLTGFHTESVGGTCGGTLNGNAYTTAPITADCTVEASFAADSDELFRDGFEMPQ